MLQDDLKGNAQENIDMINKVLIVDEIKKYPSYTDITSYWSTSVMQPNYIKEFNNLYKGFFGLVIDNPWSFVKARIKTMLSSSGLDKTPATMMNDFKTQPNQNSSYKTLEKQVLNQRLRWNFIKIINGNYFKNNIFRKIFWNYIPIVLVLGILLIYKLVKKEYILSILLLFVLVRVPLLFLTAAAHYFMYYFPTYLTGIYIIMLLIVLKLDKKRSKVK